MPYELHSFESIGLNEALLRVLIQEHEEDVAPRLERFLSYWSDETSAGDDAGTGLGQVAPRAGLPSRLTDRIEGGSPKEIVIENDIGWRVQTIVDYVAGREMSIRSLSQDARRRALLESIANAILDANGGPLFVQEAVLLGAIYGHVDLLVRPGLMAADGSGRQSESSEDAAGDVLQSARRVRIDLIEATRAIPVMSDADYRVLDAYILHFHRLINDVESVGFISRLSKWLGGRELVNQQRATAEMTEIISAQAIEAYENEMLISRTANALGRVPVVHIQHQRVPFNYGGLGEVEPLIPMQNELNTRLSDRANRVTMQSFKMYLGRGIESFIDRPIGPGQMWITDNPDASIEAFGADASSPSEEQHIQEIREAMDKISSVTPLAAGLVRTRVGTLSSENALRISLLGLLSKTERLRKLYAQGIGDALNLAMQVLDREGAFTTAPDERAFEIDWASPIPVDESQQLANARIKRDLGVRADVILEELGYGKTPTSE